MKVGEIFTGIPTKVEDCEIKVNALLTEENIEFFKSAPFEITLNLKSLHVGDTLILNYKYQQGYFGTTEMSFQYFLEMIEKYPECITSIELWELHSKTILIKDLIEKIIKIKEKL